MKIFGSETIFVTVYFIATTKKYYEVLELTTQELLYYFW